MEYTNTIERGSEFEEKVFLIIRELLDNEDFYVSGKKSYIYRKKGYYSETRKDNIVVDVSIETFLDKAEKYSLLTIIECKNYGDKGVPVDDVEEFDSKLNQLGEHNTKGIIVTNSHFQKGSISFAISKKIGLIRINEKKEIDWINYRKGVDITSTESVYNDLSSLNPNLNFIAYINKKSFSHLPDFLIESEIISQYFNKPKYINLPFRTEKEIDEIINLNELDSFYHKDKLDTEKICQYLRQMHKVNFQFDNDLGTIGANKILGKIAFSPLEIFVSKDLNKDKYRWRFTLAHEIGHLVLHHDILMNYLDENIDNDSTIDLTHDDVVSFYNKRLEIQANIFASRLLIPQEKLILQVADYFARETIHKGYLYLDHQWCNYDLTNRLLLKLQNQFFVSKEVARVRLINEGLLRDNTDLHFITARRKK